MQALADRVGVVADWNTEADRFLGLESVKKFYIAFRNLNNSRGKVGVERSFSFLVLSIAEGLEKMWEVCGENKIVIKGLLANANLAVRGDPDYAIYNPVSGGFYFSTVCERIKSWSLGETWYRDSRCIQTMMAMYAFDCPTFLYTQHQFKIFVQNRDNNSIQTFPFVNEPKHLPGHTAYSMQDNEDMFIQALVICLLSNPARNETIMAVNGGPILIEQEILKNNACSLIRMPPKFPYCVPDMKRSKREFDTEKKFGLQRI